MRFYKKKHVIEPLKNEEDEEEEKKLDEEGLLKKKKEMEERELKILQNTNVFHQNKYNMKYPSGKQRGVFYPIFDRIFIYKERLMDNRVVSMRKVKKIKRLRKEGITDYEFYYRVVFTGLIRNITIQNLSNYMDVSYLINPLSKEQRMNWIRIRKLNKKIRKKVFKNDIKIPKKDDFENEYSKS